MKKFFLLLFIISSLLIPISTAFASFIDISDYTKYREAILSLSAAGIIKGYPDFSFRPETSLKRAELVKLLLESANTPVENFAGGCFSDVQDKTQWYFKYVCTAKKLGIIKGYPDFSFKPGNSINRAEAVQILCKFQNWKTAYALQTMPFADTPIPEWFTACIDFAKQNSFLQNIIPKKSMRFFPAMPMPRGVFSEILYRSLLKQGKTFPEIEETSVTESPDPLILGGSAAEPFTHVTDIDALRKQMLLLVNQERTKRELSAVLISDELSYVAQLHSNDMVQRNFFDHVNPDGESPDDRRKNANINTPVAENLAKAPSIESAHEGLMNSPKHRENILTPEWERLGLGIAQNSEGYLLITQLFSKNPVTNADLENEKTRLFNLINEIRMNAGLQAVAQSAALNSVATEWSADMATLNFFGIEKENGEKLMDIVKSSVSSALFQLAIYESTDIGSFQTLFEQNPNRFLHSEFKYIGLGFAMERLGMIKLTVVLTN